MKTIRDMFEEIKDTIVEDTNQTVKEVLPFMSSKVEEELIYAENCHKIEEELGCPLDVLFRVLKEGIYHNKKFQHPVLVLNEDSFKKNNLSLLVVGTIVYLKEYKKTWWLREDKSE